MKPFKFTLILHKKYFDTGRGLLDVVKYFVALVGISSLNVKLTIFLGICYLVLSYFAGLIYIKYGFFEAEQEVSNLYNLFVKEMREKFK